MLWEIFAIAACIVFILFLSFWLNQQSTKALFSAISESYPQLSESAQTINVELADIKEEMLDMVHDTIKNMQPPNAFDHIVGALSGPLQMWAMRKAGIDPTTGQPIQQMEELNEPAIL